MLQTIESQKGRYAPVDIQFSDGTHYVLLCCCRGMKIFQRTLLELVGMKHKTISGDESDGSATASAELKSSCSASVMSAIVGSTRAGATGYGAHSVTCR